MKNLSSLLFKIKKDTDGRETINQAQINDKVLYAIDGVCNTETLIPIAAVYVAAWIIQYFRAGIISGESMMNMSSELHKVSEYNVELFKQDEGLDDIHTFGKVALLAG